MRYRPDIDGLRAVAIISVVLFHFSVPPFSGGFVGVDVFFVISGYLLTSIITAELKEARFSISKFYERRVRRIYPALIGVFAFCILTACVLFPPLKMQGFGRTLIAASLFFSNISFMRSMAEKGYFADELSKPVLLHTWSLSIEEQFYLFLPVLLFITTRYLNRFGVVVIALILVNSLLFSMSVVGSAPNVAFFSLHARAWELLVGVMAAQLDLPILERRLLREFLAALGGFGVLFSIFFFGPNTPFPGFAALAPVGGTACLLIAGRPGGTITGRVLSLRPAVAIGKLSYSLYLWHWPILITIGTLILRPLEGWEKAPAIAASLVAAVLSYWLVEQPFRARGLVPKKSAILWLGGAASVVMLVIGFGLSASSGWPQRFTPTARALLAYNEALEKDFDSDPIACLNFQKDVRTIQDVNQCPIGRSAPRKILFWGDSHMGQLYPAIEDLHRSGRLFGLDATFMMSAGCPPAMTLNIIDPHYYCDRFSLLALQRAEQPDISIVFIMFTGSPWQSRAPVMARVEDGRRAESLSAAKAEGIFLEDLGRTVDDLLTKGKHIVLALPQPEYDRPIPKVILSNLLSERFGIKRNAQRSDFTELREKLVAMFAGKGVVIFDPREDLCPNDHCLYEKDGRAIYRDANHVPGSLSKLFEQNLYRTLQRAQ